MCKRMRVCIDGYELPVNEASGVEQKVQDTRASRSCKERGTALTQLCLQESCLSVSYIRVKPHRL
jgi:hypothetical protein